MTPEPRLRARHVAFGCSLRSSMSSLLVTAIGRWRLGTCRTRCRCRRSGSWAVRWARYWCSSGTGVLRRAIAVDDGRTRRRLLSAVGARQLRRHARLFSFAGVAGLAIVYWTLRRLGRDRDRAAVVLIGLNTCVYLVFGAIGWIAAAVALLTGEVGRRSPCPG